MNAEDAIFLETAGRLKEAARLGRSFEAAQVKIIGLDEIRRAAGEDWSMIGGRIRANSMRFLQGCLSQDDLVIPAGDGFLVIYANGAGRDFESETATILDALNGFYLGQEATNRLTAQAKHERVDASGMAELVTNTESSDVEVPTNTCPHLLSFVPIWNAKQEAITGYWTAPVYRTESDRLFGYDQSWAETRVQSDDNYLSLDLAIVDRAVREAESSIESGRRCLVGYSVHSTTLQNRDRRHKFLNDLYKTPETLRPYLVGRIAEIEPGTPSMTMAGWVHLLRPVSNRVTLQLHETDRALDGLDSTGAFSASFTLPPRQADRAVQQACIRHIGRWTTALQRQRIMLRVDNVNDASLLTYALSSGVDFLTSERIWPAVPAPQGVSLFGRNQLRTALTAVAA